MVAVPEGKPSAKEIAKRCVELFERKLRGEFSQKTLEEETANLLKGQRQGDERFLFNITNGGEEETSGENIA